MRRRLDLAMTLVSQPRVIFLDEPTTGLDPRSRHTMWQIIGELVADGVTILLTTQYLDDADQLADRVAVLNRGRIVAEGTPTELKRRTVFALVREPTPGIEPGIFRLQGGSSPLTLIHFRRQEFGDVTQQTCSALPIVIISCHDPCHAPRPGPPRPRRFWLSLM
jgi:ABC-type multidrug transport system ATPase subunit